MFVSAKKKDDSRWQIQIVESIRIGDQVRQKRVRNIGTAYSEKEREEFIRIGNAAIIKIKNDRNPVLPIFDPADIHAPRTKKKEVDDDARVKNLKHVQTYNDGIRDIFGKVYDELGLENVIDGSRKDEQWNSILKENVAARIADPKSKRASAQMLKRDHAVEIPLEKTYRMMDHLEEREEQIKSRITQATLTIFKEAVDVLFFDVTTLYFESFTADELRNFGFSKDCKFKETQVVLALVTTKDGLPITYKLFPGNTYEGSTLVGVVKDLKKEFLVDSIMLVADRGMFNKENLRCLEAENVNYIVAAKLKSLPKQKRQEILDSKDFRVNVVNDELHWVNEFSHEGRRLIVSYSSKRANKDASDRHRLVERLLKKVKNKKIKIADIIPNQGTKKFLKITGGQAVVDDEKIAVDHEWDGLHGICTNSPERNVASLLERYRGLWQIEEAFRVNKHDLKMRPIFHWTPRRIKAHISMCFIAYAVVKHTIFYLKEKKILLSVEQLREELLRVESVLYRDKTTDKHYVLPSSTNALQKSIYRALRINREERPFSVE